VCWKRLFYFEKASRGSRAIIVSAFTRSPYTRARSGSLRQQDAKGSTPTHGVPFTVSRRRLSATETLMGVFILPLRSSALGYFRKPRNEASECEKKCPVVVPVSSITSSQVPSLSLSLSPSVDAVPRCFFCSCLFPEDSK